MPSLPIAFPIASARGIDSRSRPHRDRKVARFLRKWFVTELKGAGDIRGKSRRRETFNLTISPR